MRPGRMVRRFLFGGLIIVFGVLAGPLAVALAAPSLSIQTPEQGSVTNESRPLIAGHSSDSSDGVTVTLLRGSTEVESTVVEPELGSGAWAVQFSAKLSDGGYTAVAEQTEMETGESSVAGSEFTVFTAKPEVTLNAISSPTKDSMPSFSGTASEHTGVTVYVFAGSPAEED